MNKYIIEERTIYCQNYYHSICMKKRGISAMYCEILIAIAIKVKKYDVILRVCRNNNIE